MITICSKHDIFLFNNAAPIVNGSIYFTEDDHIVEDTGYIGSRQNVPPYKLDNFRNDTGST